MFDRFTQAFASNLSQRIAERNSQQVAVPYRQQRLTENWRQKAVGCLLLIEAALIFGVPVRMICWDFITAAVPSITTIQNHDQDEE